MVEYFQIEMILVFLTSRDELTGVLRVVTTGGTGEY